LDALLLPVQRLDVLDASLVQLDRKVTLDGLPRSGVA
jgi:hypothetical protein